MTGRRSAFSTSVGTKILIGLTGLLLFVYLVVHLLGNLAFFLGPGVFNTYAHVLTGNPLIWAIEVLLLIFFLLHVYKTVVNWWANRQARPVAYVNKKLAGPPSRKGLASSTMIYTGALVLLFVVLHVRAFKYGRFYAEPGTGVRDLHRLEVEIFSDPVVVVFYAVCMVLLGSHLWHGFSSAFQSLGASHPKITQPLLVLGRVLAVIIAGGFLAIPVLVYFTMGAR